MTDSSVLAQQINQRLQLITRRADRADDVSLVDTFVSIGGVENILLNPENQIILGRRGTGKTHALRFLQQKAREREVSLFIDLRQLGSDGSIYANDAIPLDARVARVVTDFFGAVHELLLDEATRPESTESLFSIVAHLDKLADAISAVRVEEIIEVETEDSVASSSAGATRATAELSETPKIGVSTKNSENETTTQRVLSRSKGTRKFHVHFSTLQSVLRDIVRASRTRLWIFIDEWSSLPVPIQPYLADVLRRVMFPIRDITIVIGAIEHRSTLQIFSKNSYIGIEVGADCAVSINLDDFMVFENDPDRAKRFFRTLIYKHYRIKKLEGFEASDFSSETEFISKAFTQGKAFDELIQASEGVPRDAINILSLAAAQAGDARITVGKVRNAAGKWFSQDKSQFFKEHTDAEYLLAWIVDKVIGERRSRAFLVETTTKNRLMDDLYDGRMLHVLKRSVSAHDRPGVRYIAYKIVYGCYVDILTTSRAPGGLLSGEDIDGNEVFIDVPPDDYRSIRRSILDIDTFNLDQTKSRWIIDLGRPGGATEAIVKLVFSKWADAAVETSKAR